MKRFSLEEYLEHPDRKVVRETEEMEELFVLMQSVNIRLLH